MLGLILFGLGCTGCSRPTHYRDATWEKLDDQLIFRGDRTCAREPMPLNTQVDFVPFGTQWGFAWRGVYRDAGAINRTLTTSVLYLGATDERLNTRTSGLLRVAVSEDSQGTSIDYFPYPTPVGVSMIYQLRPGEARCAGLNLRTQLPMPVQGKCHFMGMILKNGGPEADWAVQFHEEHTHALMLDRGIVLVRSGDAKSQELLVRIPGTEGITDPVAADLFLEGIGVSMIWAQPSSGCGESGTADSPKMNCSTLHYAYWSFGQQNMVRAALPVKGDPGQFLVSLQRDERGVFALIRSGNRVVRQDFDPGTRQPGALTELIDLSKHSDRPQQVRFACKSEECLVLFADNEKYSWIFSTKTGLRKRPGLNRRVRCGLKACLEDLDPGLVGILPTP